MPRLLSASPQISLRLYKTISRKTIDGQTAVSARYQGKDEFIDLTPFLSETSSVRTTKSVQEPAGAFTITFSDQAQKQLSSSSESPSALALESVYGLVEPMDMVEIRMWSGLGQKPAVLPIIMRGFVSSVQRQQSMGDNGQPQRSVVISGQDYGKIWQIFRVLYLKAYAEGTSLLTNFALTELFGIQAVNAMPASEFVKTMIEKVINPFLKHLLPENSPLPNEIKTSEGIAVKHGVVNMSLMNIEGSIYDILTLHGDVGVWNELYTEDREDGVHVVYRPIPALKLPPKGDPAKRKIQDDAPDPVVVKISNEFIQNISSARSDSNVANFFWVNNSRFDLIDDMQRKLASIPKNDGRVSIDDYPNSATRYYGVRPMYAATQQAGDEVTNLNSGVSKDELEKRSTVQEEWIDKRRRLMIEMNKDNVVFERGSVRMKGGPVRDSDAGKVEAMKAGDYAEFNMGTLFYLGYVTEITHEFNSFESYTTTLTYERGEGFAVRTSLEGGISSPWLAEQALVPFSVIKGFIS